jgi:hypothetical protein
MTDLRPRKTMIVLCIRVARSVTQISRQSIAMPGITRFGVRHRILVLMCMEWRETGELTETIHLSQRLASLGIKGRLRNVIPQPMRHAHLTTLLLTCCQKRPNPVSKSRMDREEHRFGFCVKWHTAPSQG